MPARGRLPHDAKTAGRKRPHRYPDQPIDRAYRAYRGDRRARWLPVRVRYRRHQRRRRRDPEPLPSGPAAARAGGRLGADWLGGRCLLRGPLGRSPRPGPGHGDRRHPVLHQRAGLGVRLLTLGADAVPARRRPRCRHRVGDRPGLYRRDRPRRPARAARLAAAARHRHWHLRRTPDGLLLRHRGGRFKQRPVVRAPGVALDVPGRAGPGGDLRHPRAEHPGVAAIPRRQVPRLRRDQSAEDGGRLRRGTIQAGGDPQDAGQAKRAAASAT